MLLCSHFEYPICDCVHSYFIPPCQTPFWNMSFSSEGKAVDCLRTNKNCVHRNQVWTLPYFASLLLKRSDTVLGTAQIKVRGKIIVKNFSFLFFTQWYKTNGFDCSIVILSFRRALSSCCLQQTCPCKHPVSMFILVCNTSFWLQLFKGWITLSKNLFPLDNAIVSCHNSYPLDSDLSIG